MLEFDIDINVGKMFGEFTKAMWFFNEVYQLNLFEFIAVPPFKLLLLLPRKIDQTNKSRSALIVL